MSESALQELRQALRKIDRPGSFCVRGSVPAVLPGLEVKDLGPIGLPLTTSQAQELKKHCEQAPYGKGEKTLVDTNVRRVWRLQPERFALRSPDWEPFIEQMVGKVQEELGLQEQKLQSHLYELLLYEPGSFFLPHRDGEKHDRMVATLVVVLPSTFQGGELVVRHEGQEQVIDFSGDNLFRIHYAAFYADCEHEIRPLREGYRLCLVYNLTLAKSKKPITAPRHSEQVEKIAQALRKWAKKDTPRKLAITLEHQYTQEGLTWDALKGVDRAWAQVLAEAARQADCQVHLALLTYHESGSAEGGDYYGRHYHRRGRWYNDEDDDDYDEADASDYEMGEIFETSLTATHWSDPEGKRVPFGELDVEVDEVLDPEAIQDVEPEEDFEGYTGNAGMTLDRWYRHAAIILWPNQRHFDILCDAGTQSAVAGLGLWVKRWQQADKEEAGALRAECIDFATKILARWPENRYGLTYFQGVQWGGQVEEEWEEGPEEEWEEDWQDDAEDEWEDEPEQQANDPLPLLAALGELGLIKTYLGEVLIKDASIDPGKALVPVCKQHGWATFQPELEAVCRSTTTETLQRNIGLLESICLARPKQKAGWAELCRSLAHVLVEALEGLDEKKSPPDWRARPVKRAEVLVGLARALLATEQFELLSRVVAHALADPRTYPLTEAHVAALTTLKPWLAKHIKEPCPPLSHWLDACCQQLESLTAQTPQPPADFRRPAALSCTCPDCTELSRFLDDRREKVHRFSVAEARRNHLDGIIRQNHCDLDCTTERRGRPYTLICTKNTASYHASLRKFHEDQQHLATLRAIQESLPK
jgi:hypothetical protein